MNRRDSIKANAEKVEKRYAKTIKGTTKGKTKPKLKLKPVLKKGTIGIRGKVTF